MFDSVKVLDSNEKRGNKVCVGLNNVASLHCSNGKQVLATTKQNSNTVTQPFEDRCSHSAKALVVRKYCGGFFV